MALYIPHSIFHLARLLYVRPETLDPTTYIQYWPAKMDYIRYYNTVPYLTHKHVYFGSFMTCLHLHHIFSVPLTLAVAVPETSVKFISLTIIIKITCPKINLFWNFEKKNFITQQQPNLSNFSRVKKNLARNDCLIGLCNRPAIPVLRAKYCK